MAIDVQEVPSAAIPESVPVATPEAAPASPPTEAPRSPGFRERLSTFFPRGDAGRATSTEAVPQDAPPPEPTVATESSPVRPEPLVAFQTQEEWEHYRQSEVDKEINRREKLARDRQIADLETQIEAATEADDTWTAGELAKQITSLKRGVRVDQTQAQSQEQVRAQIAEAHQLARLQTAADLDHAYTDPLLSQLEEGARKETLDWYSQAAKRPGSDPVALRQKFAERAATALYEQGRDQGRNEVLDKVDPSSTAYDPEFAKLVRATQNGDIEEPPTLSGGAASLATNYATYDELVIAHASNVISSAEFRRQRGRFR